MRQLKELKLQKYRKATAEELPLDLRENLRVKTEKAAFIDLERSFFLHRLKALGVSFCLQKARPQDNATWAEPVGTPLDAPGGNRNSGGLPEGRHGGAGGG